MPKVTCNYCGNGHSKICNNCAQAIIDLGRAGKPIRSIADIQEYYRQQEQAPPATPSPLAQHQKEKVNKHRKKKTIQQLLGEDRGR